jgi:hypothetical protein
MLVSAVDPQETLAQIAKTVSELGRRDTAIQKEMKQRTASRDKAGGWIWGPWGMAVHSG